MTTAIVTDKLADGINAAHRKAEKSAGSAIEYAAEAGRLLIEAKAKVGHGGFGKWVRENCEFNPRTATTYMRIANTDPAKLSNRQADSDLKLMKDVLTPVRPVRPALPEKVEVEECLDSDEMVGQLVQEQDRAFQRMAAGERSEPDRLEQIKRLWWKLTTRQQNRFRKWIDEEE